MQSPLRRILTAIQVLVAAASLTLVMAPTASASTFYGTYFNSVTGIYEGNYTYVDCRGCPDDGAILVSNVKNGYYVRVRFYAQVNGTWYTYLDRSLPDGYSGKWASGYPPAGAKVRLYLCTYDSRGVLRGSCTNHYGYNNTY